MYVRYSMYQICMQGHAADCMNFLMLVTCTVMVNMKKLKCALAAGRVWRVCFVCVRRWKNNKIIFLRCWPKFFLVWNSTLIKFCRCYVIIIHHVIRTLYAFRHEHHPGAVLRPEDQVVVLSPDGSNLHTFRSEIEQIKINLGKNNWKLKEAVNKVPSEVHIHVQHECMNVIHTVHECVHVHDMYLGRNHAYSKLSRF